MANKKNLPNIPIYIGDWERDCNVLSLESEAAWMRVVFKLWTKGKQSSYKIPTKSLQNLWRCSADKMKEILDELIFNEIAEITVEDGFILFTCRRFVKENELSNTRKEAVSKRKDRSEVLQKPYKKDTKVVQITENEDDIESEIRIEKERFLETEDNFDYMEVFDSYHEVCPELPRVERNTDRRKRLIQDRVKEFNLSGVQEVFSKASKSKFLNGDNVRHWSADFEWIMTLDNFIKIKEGKYTDQKKKKVVVHNRPSNHNRPKQVTVA